MKKLVKASLDQVFEFHCCISCFVYSSGNKNCLWEENIPLEDVPESIANETLISGIPGILSQKWLSH